MMVSSPSSLLRQAIVAQDPDRALELLRTKVSCPDIEDGETNLVRAMQHCPHFPQLIEPLIAGRGLDVLEFADERGNTPMMVAAGWANVVAINLLIKAGAKVCDARLLRDVVMHSMLRIGGLFGVREHAHAQVLEAAQTLVRHGAPVEDFADEKSLVRSYLMSWGFGRDPHLVRFLVAEGAAAPSKEAVLRIDLGCAKTSYVAIEQGLAERQWRQGARDAITTEFGVTMPNMLLALIQEYI